MRKTTIVTITSKLRHRLKSRHCQNCSCWPFFN